MTRPITPTPATQPARHSTADVIAGAVIVLAAITAVLGALILRERPASSPSGALMIRGGW